MDLSTMRKKLDAGAYEHWQPMEHDLDLMFTNAMTYNDRTTFVHKQVRADYSFVAAAAS